jgi:hypothetical protein
VSTPDYPLLTVPGYELYQLAHLTSFAVDALARHRRATETKDRPVHRAHAATKTLTDAAEAGPTQATAFPGGFRAAATALPSPGARPPRDLAATTYRKNTEARPGLPADALPRPSPRQAPAPSPRALHR